jgi:hypothetical protein
MELKLYLSMEDLIMDKRTTGIIATTATALICGCCSLFGCIMGIGAITGNGTLELGGTTQPMPPSYGYVFLCLSLLFILVPVVVGFVTLRKKPEAAAPTTAPASPAETVVSQPKPPAPPSKKPAKPEDDEPLPPAS